MAIPLVKFYVANGKPLPPLNEPYLPIDWHKLRVLPTGAGKLVVPIGKTADGFMYKFNPAFIQKWRNGITNSPRALTCLEDVSGNYPDALAFNKESHQRDVTDQFTQFNYVIVQTIEGKSVQHRAHCK
jgi:hypothetical protein